MRLQLEYGYPVPLAFKDSHPTTHYVWRTAGDERVRESHAENNGRVFAWDDPPDTGHPGTDFGCRCVAEPYLVALEEFIEIRPLEVYEDDNPWSTWDFVHHYRHGAGREVTLREIGHLSTIVSFYAREVHAKLRMQLAREARANIGSGFSYPFVNTYDLTGEVFSIGDTTIRGTFTGSCHRRIGFIEFSGRIDFELDDAFQDPFDLGSFEDATDAIASQVASAPDTLVAQSEAHLRARIAEALAGYYRQGLKEVRLVDPENRWSERGQPYRITGTWTAEVHGRIHADPHNSVFDWAPSR